VSGIVRRVRDAVRAFPWLKTAVAACVALYLFLSAKGLASIGDLAGWHAIEPLAIALLPVCVFLTFRYPLIFPFGLYVALVPFDALLAVSGGATLVRLIGFAAAGALALRTLVTRRALVPGPSWYPWVALVAYAALTLMWTPEFGKGANTFATMLMLLLMMTVLATYPVGKMEFQITMALTVLAGVGAAVFTLHQYYSGHVTLDVNSHGHRLALQGFSSSNIEDPNFLAGAFLIAMALALAGLFYARGIAVRLACVLAIPPMIAAVLVTGSRSALFGAVALFAYFAIRSKHRLGALALGGVALVTVTAFYPDVLARLFDKTFVNGSGRTDIWQTGLHSFSDHWLFGAGVESYQYVYDRNLLQVFQPEFAGWTRPGHSLIFVSLNDFGVLGFALVLVCWYVGFRQLSVIPKTSWLYGTRLGLEAGMLALFIHMLFLDPFYIKYVWLGQSLPLIALNLYAPRALRAGRRISAPVPRMRPAQSLRGP
jgi:hypothetical protein